MKILLLILATLSFAHAKDDYKFRPDYWSKGLHLVAGGGLNAVHFNSDKQYDEIGYGLNFKTDLGYYFSNRFAIEWSSNVKFNKIDHYLVWDTLITFGLRYRIKEYYVRGFFGKSPTIVFFNGDPPDEYENSRASRLQFDGPVYGLGVGKMLQHNDNLIWFLETSATFQRLEQREAIHMNGQVPEVIGRQNDDATVLSVYFNIGVLIF